VPLRTTENVVAGHIRPAGLQ